MLLFLSFCTCLATHLGVLSLGLLQDTRDRDRRSVDLGHKEPLEDSSVEPRVGPSGEESVKLDQQKEVRVLALGSGSVALPDVVVLNVDTHLIIPIPTSQHQSSCRLLSPSHSIHKAH